MEIVPQNGAIGATVGGFELGRASEGDYRELKEALYRNKILLIKDQRSSSEKFIELGRALGTIEVYHEPMYHHPEYREIFVSATAPEQGEQVGVPKTGKFRHADHSFMPSRSASP
jgi:taurine dioxygenase